MKWINGELSFNQLRVYKPDPKDIEFHEHWTYGELSFNQLRGYKPDSKD